MQVYKCFFRILKKQMGQIIMYLGIFLALSIVVSLQGAENKGAEFEAAEFSFSVFDEDDSPASKQMTAYLAKENELVEIPDEKSAVQDELYNRHTHCVLRIPKGFGESLKEDEVKEISLTSVPGTFYGEIFEGKVNGYVTVLRNYLKGGFDEAEALKRAEKTLALEPEVELSSARDESIHSKMYYFFNYVPYIFLCICVVAITPVLIVFRGKGIGERMESSAYPVSKVNLSLCGGIVTAGIGLVVIHSTMVAALTKGALFSGKGLLYVANVVSFTFVAISFVFLIGRFVKRLEVLSMIANVAALGMSFLGGIFVPLHLLGDGVVRIAHFLPAYWYIRAAGWIDSYTGGSKAELYEFYGIQLLFAVAFLCVGFAFSHGKREA